MYTDKARRVAGEAPEREAFRAARRGRFWRAAAILAAADGYDLDWARAAASVSEIEVLRMESRAQTAIRDGRVKFTNGARMGAYWLDGRWHPDNRGEQSAT